MLRSHMPCGQPKFSSMPSQPVSSTAAGCVPALLVQRHHQADHHRAIRPVALDLFDLVEVHLQRPVGDQLDIVEARHALCRCSRQRAVAADDIDDRRVFAERLPHHAAPARLERAHHVVRLVGRRRGGEPERVGRRGCRRSACADRPCSRSSQSAESCRWRAAASLPSCTAETVRSGAGHAVAAGVNPGSEAAPAGVNRDAPVAHRSMPSSSGSGTKRWPIALSTMSAGSTNVSSVGSAGPSRRAACASNSTPVTRPPCAEQPVRRRPVADAHAVGLRPVLLVPGRGHLLRRRGDTRWSHPPRPAAATASPRRSRCCRRRSPRRAGRPARRPVGACRSSAMKSTASRTPASRLARDAERARRRSWPMPRNTASKSRSQRRT